VIKRNRICGRGKGSYSLLRKEKSWNVSLFFPSLPPSLPLSFFFDDGIKLAQSSKCVINKKTLPGGKVP
jgi:hypothetical protein